MSTLHSLPSSFARRLAFFPFPPGPGGPLRDCLALLDGEPLCSGLAPLAGDGGEVTSNSLRCSHGFIVPARQAELQGWS